jgi:heme exporter protein D
MSNTNAGSLDERTRRNTVRLGLWTGAWLISMAVAVFGPIFVWESRAVSLVAILINVALGICMMIANKRYLDGLDELQRKIQLDAMALALGMGLVIGLGYSAMDIANVIEVDAEISFLVMLIGVIYLLGILIGRRKYQ